MLAIFGSSSSSPESVPQIQQTLCNPMSNLESQISITEEINISISNIARRVSVRTV